MAIELKVPTVGESITEVQIGEWLKAEGEAVSRDEIIVKIETDKVTVDFSAPSDGVLSRIVVKKGQTAAVGDVIGVIEEGAAASAESSGARPEPAKAESAKAPSLPRPSLPRASRPLKTFAPEERASARFRRKASPA